MLPNLETKRLALRQLKNEDAPEIFKYRSNDEVMRYIARPRAKTIEDALELIERINTLIEKEEGYNWGITLKEIDKVIGTVGYVKLKKEHFRAEIGYMLDPQFHRQGIMNEAIVQVLHYGFNELNLHSVEALVDPANIASISILEKNNFIREAYFKEDFYWEGKFLDSAVYSLLKSRFQ